MPGVNIIPSIGGVGGGGGIEIQVVVDSTGVDRAMQSLKSKMDHKREPLRRCAQDYMAREVIKERFDAEGIPRWKRHALSTVLRAGGEYKLLYKTGKLFHSVTGGAGYQMQFYPSSISPEMVLAGSSLTYATVHDQPRGTYTQVGRSLIPGRPWSDIYQKNVDRMLQIVLDWTKEKIKESGFY